MKGFEQGQSQRDRELTQKWILHINQQLRLNSYQKSKKYDYDFDRDLPLTIKNPRYVWTSKLPEKEVDAPRGSSYHSSIATITSLKDLDFENPPIPDISVGEVPDLELPCTPDTVFNTDRFSQGDCKFN